jgi:hypothetical protein
VSQISKKSPTLVVAAEAGRDPRRLGGVADRRGHR